MSPHENGTLENEGLKNAKDLDVIQKVIAVKDKFRISDEALHELHMIGSIIPSKSAINEEKIRLNTTLEIMSHPSVSPCTAFKCVNHFQYFYCIILISIL